MKLEKIEKILEGKFINRFNLTYKTRNNNKKVYEVVSRKKNLTEETLNNPTEEAVMIIPFNEDMTKICVNKEFRLSANREIYDFASGLIDKGEDVLSAVKRELKEETGLDLKEVIIALGGSYTAIGVSNEKTALCICTATGSFENKNLEEAEEIESMWIDKNTALEIAKNQECAARTQLFLYLWGKNSLEL